MKKKYLKMKISPLLEFVLRYAEIIKYANETVGSYGKYMRTMSNEYITISNTGLDEIFDVLKSKEVAFKIDLEDTYILFEDHNPEIKFIVKQGKNQDYSISPNIDAFSYHIMQGSSYTYLLNNKKLYRCDKKLCRYNIKIIKYI